jgi:2-polyprenyl-6-methoxyphenol hydroxylase-like FAD-dependent oxidoreductase
MKILIVGAGIGGMSLAALLDHRAMSVTLVERAPNFDHAGYMLGLWPLGYRVLHGLSLYERFVAECIPGNHYEVRDDHGDLVKRWSLEAIAKRFGPNLSCTRPQLVKLLHDGLGEAELRFGTELETVKQEGEEVEATFSDGSHGTFDLVVGADGLHSRVRNLVFGEQPYFHTGWGGWVWWASLASVPPATFVEHWGAGRFIGAYPTPEGAGIFAGAPLGGNFERPGQERRQRVRSRFAGMGKLVDAWLDAMPDDNAELFFWSLSDVRSADWTRGRIVLLGDAAAAFLPTAGIGASMAMESAAVLADELSRTDARFVERALSLYVKRRRGRVERIQDNSRSLARTMFVKSTLVTYIRNLATKFYSLERLASSVAKAFDEPI